jgi:hypothetical protein
VTDEPTIARLPGALTESVGDDAVVLDPLTGTYTRLNATGSLLWNLLAEPATVGALGARLARDHGLAEDVALRDADRFVSALRERGLLEAASPPS